MASQGDLGHSLRFTTQVVDRRVGGERGCQRFDRIRRRGNKTPTVAVGLRCPPRRPRSMSIRRSGLECRETLGPPVSWREAQTSWHLALASRRDERREEERTGNARDTGKRQPSCGRSRSDASRTFTVLARRKLGDPPDASHEWRDGETVRMARGLPKRQRVTVCGFRLASSRHDGRRPRSARVGPLRERRGGFLRLDGQASSSFSRTETTNSASDGKEAGSGVPPGDHEGVRGTVRLW